MTRFHTILVMLILVCRGQGWSQAKRNCLSYEPAVVKVTGTIISRTYPGPPNYESVRGGDEAETYWLLALPRPICVNQREPADLVDEAKTNIHRIQLVFISEEAYVTYRRLLGKRVVATGTLYGSFTGHHHTPVLLRVKSLVRAR